MFDTLMRGSMPIWIVVSALYPVFVVLFVFRAAGRIRDLRRLRSQMQAVQARGVSAARAWNEAQVKDWMPTP